MNFTIIWKKKIGGNVVKFTENFHNITLATNAFESLLEEKKEDKILSVAFEVK